MRMLYQEMIVGAFLRFTGKQKVRSSIVYQVLVRSGEVGKQIHPSPAKRRIVHLTLIKMKSRNFSFSYLHYQELDDPHTHQQS